MKKILSLLLLTPHLGLCQFKGANFDSIFVNYSAEKPGLVVMINHRGQTLYKKAFGLADVSKKIPNTVDHRFEIASNAKQITAMCIALLIESGRLSEYDQLKKFYPNLKIEEPIDVRHLLSHTSGLREASVLAILSGKMNLKGEVRKKFRTKEFYLQCLRRETDLNFKPGDELAYTNFNYTLLADIVEKVSGTSFAQFCDSAIFRPLEMKNTIVRDEKVGIIDDEANGYLYTGKAFKERRYKRGGMVGDHNISSTVDDLMKWEMNFWNNGLGLKDSALKTKISTPFKLNNGETSGYAYGVWVDRYRGLPKISHGGDDGAYTSFLLNFPQQEVAIVVVANSSRYWETEKAAYQIADILLKDKFLEPARERPAYKYIDLPDSSLADKAGLYTHVDKSGLAAILRLRFQDGKLFVSRNYNHQGLELNPISAEDFIAVNPLNYVLYVRFLQDSAGTVRQRFETNPPIFFQKAKQTTPNFSSYSGRFWNESTGAVIHIKSKKDKIIARKGVIRIPLIPFDIDQFYAIENDALFIFKKDPSGHVRHLLVNAPDFRRFQFEKTD